MKKIWVMGLLGAWICGAQQVAPSLAEIEASLRADMRGDGEPALRSNMATEPASRQLLPPANEETSAARRRPLQPATGTSVSVAQLKHKVPKEAQKAFTRAQGLSRAGNHEEAARELEKATARDPEYAVAHSDLGVEYAQLGRFEEAEKELKRAIALDPAASAYYNLSLVYFQTGDATAAEASVRTALALPGSDAMAHLFLANLLLTGPDPNKRVEAEGHLRYAARSIPEAAEMLHKLQAAAQ